MIRLKEVDGELRQLGAVPYKGSPMLPVHFVQTEEFDEQVRLFFSLQESTQPISGQQQQQLAFGEGGGVGFYSVQDAKNSLHAYLTSKHKVNRRKRQAALDVLVDERIDILLKLCSYNPEETPFSFDREFK